ncbi:MAG: sterol desaturase family protein [Cyclobacteriaceae bacterium]
MKLENKPHSKGTASLFSNRALERLTRTHIVIPLVTFMVISGSLIYYGLFKNHITFMDIPFPFTVGLLVFTLFEYVMHRFVFHLIPKTDKQKKFAYTAHGVHHDYPKDRDRLAMPLPLSLLITFLFYIIFRATMGDLVYGALPGFLMGYTAYLWVHYMVHAYKPPRNFFKVWWVHHGTHHYKDQENAFGVSSPLWDWVFGTMPNKKNKNKVY